MKNCGNLPRRRNMCLSHRVRSRVPSRLQRSVANSLARLLILALVLPLWSGAAALAQEEPPIVPALGEDAVAVVDGQPVVPDEAPVAVVEGESVAQPEAPAAAVELAPANAPLAPPPSIPLQALNWAPPRSVYLPTTGQAIDGVFLDVWRAWGGALSWGEPITREFEENGHIVQYYAFGRFEYWPEDPNGVVVHFGNLGVESRPFMFRRGLPGESAAATESARAARAWLPIAGEPVEPADLTQRFVAETGHSINGDFRAFWEATGEAGYLGNPVSEPYVVSGVTYQYFERGKLGQQPGGLPYLLPIGEIMATRYGLDRSPAEQGTLPIYDEGLFVPPPIPLGNGVMVDPNAEKWIRVSISQQYLWAMQGDVILWEGYISTGKPGFDTPMGTYHILSKLESQTMEGVLGGEYYNVPDVPNVMYFTDFGHALHGTYWHNNFGVPMSHGCINLPMDVAAWMYQWVPVGARVEIVS